MRNPKSTPLQRLNDAADRIREQYVTAFAKADWPAVCQAEEKALALGLKIRTDAEGRVTVSR